MEVGCDHTGAGVMLLIGPHDHSHHVITPAVVADSPQFSPFNPGGSDSALNARKSMISGSPRVSASGSGRGAPGRPYQCDPHSPGEPAGLSRRHRIPGLDVGERRREGSSHLELAGDILGVTMHTLDLINSSAREAALMSVAAGSLKSVRRACQTLMRLLGVVTPDPHAHWVHHRHFDRFQATTDGQPGEGLLAR